MLCTVYWRKGGFLLVPDCMKASRDAEQLYGPLQLCGWVNTDSLCPELGQAIEREVESELFMALSPELAVRLGYQATDALPLPAGFTWREGDWWEGEGEVSLLYGENPPVVVAMIGPGGKQGGWITVTSLHRPWEFQGTRVSATRPGAMQYLAMWAEQNRAAVRGSVSARSH